MKSKGSFLIKKYFQNNLKTALERNNISNIGKPGANYCIINTPPDSQHERNVTNVIHILSSSVAYSLFSSFIEKS